MLYGKRDRINRVLAKWNPLGVPKELAIEEYTSYVSTIINSSDDEGQLMSCLEDILINDLETGYDKSNKEHYDDLEKVVKEIHKIINQPQNSQ